MRFLCLVDPFQDGRCAALLGKNLSAQNRACNYGNKQSIHPYTLMRENVMDSAVIQPNYDETSSVRILRVILSEAKDSSFQNDKKLMIGFVTRR